MSSHIDATIQTVRRISTELRPGILDHLGLVAAIEWQANEFQTRTGIKCNVRNSTCKTRILDEDLNTVFFRIFQETLTNIIRHAGATQVEVHLHEEAGRLILEVKDNGRGITKEQISNTQIHGLAGHAGTGRPAWAAALSISRSEPEKGTKVTVSIPFPAPARTRTKRHHENSYSRRPRSRTPRLEANPRR